MTTFGAVMPTYNQAKFIRAALTSVINQLDQLIIVNDGSTDDTLKILERLNNPKVTVVTLNTNSGTANAINRGREILNTDWQTWISSDNTYTHDWVATLAEEIKEEVGVVYSSYFRVEETAMFSTLPSFSKHDPNKLISQLECYYGPSFFIKKDIWDLTGEHRGKISHDYDHWLRVEEACEEQNKEIIFVDYSLCYYLAHDQRASILKRHEFDAHIWQAEAIKRRAQNVNS